MIKGNNVEDIGLKKPRLSLEERIFKSRLGYNAELFDEMGEFNSVVMIADDTSHVRHLYFSEFDFLKNDLKKHVKSYFLYLFPRYLPDAIYRHWKVLRYFTSKLAEGETTGSALELTIKINPNLYTPIVKSLVQFLILNEYEGLPFEKAEEILKLEGYSSGKNAYLSLFTLDEELGPFTREELRVLNDASQNESIDAADRLILALCIRFGLRPIQMSLLKESDFVEDAELGLCYLNIPRVKQNTKYRRKEFTKRAIDDDLAELIKQVLTSNKKVYGGLKLDSPPLFFRKMLGTGKTGYRIKHAELWDNTGKQDFAHHVRPRVIGSRLTLLVDSLPLSPRTGKPFHLTPYRFRYTVGTNAVVEGMTEEEVADLLDHSSTLCVKHYFRYTREMWELLENATVKRTEQQHFTAAWNREDDLSGNI